MAILVNDLGPATDFGPFSVGGSSQKSVTIPLRSPCWRFVQLLGVTREAAAEDKERKGACGHFFREIQENHGMFS